MRILATMPGRYGDILWALPTIRAISEAYGVPVDVGMAPKYGSIATLIEAQPYVGVAGPLDYWAIEETAPISPRIPPDLRLLDGITRYYDAVYHLGYEGWPTGTLAEDIWRRARDQYERQHPQEHFLGRGVKPPDLDRPWITSREPHLAAYLDEHIPARPTTAPRVYLGWSEEWFELKVGLSVLLAQRFPHVEFRWMRAWGGRYDELGLDGIGPRSLGVCRSTWETAATIMDWSDIYVGCLSSAWVLANATGTPAIVCEPNPQRHHPVFWQDGKGRNVLVKGNDGLPTFDARHVGDALEAAIQVVDRVRLGLGAGE